MIRNVRGSEIPKVAYDFDFDARKFYIHSNFDTDV